MEKMFSARIKTLRIEKGYTQVTFAKAIDVSKGLISLWENGLREPSLSSLVRMSNIFDVSIDYIVGRVDFY